MKKLAAFFLTIISYSCMVNAQDKKITDCDFDSYEKLAKEVKEHRKDKLLTLDQFLQMSKEENTVILDIRSDSMYKAKHLKGAIHLDFSDFNQQSLKEVIPKLNTKILLYCNNNFFGDREGFWMLKSAPPPNFQGPHYVETKFPLSIPAYITLYGYGYKNIYQLAEVVHVEDAKVEFERTAVE